MKRNCFKKRFCTKAAFTLIELLVVVLIIGILAAIAVPQYQLAVLKSRSIEAMLMGDKIWEAQQVYYLANGTYATRFDQLDIQIGPGDATNMYQHNFYCSLYSSTAFICIVYQKGNSVSFSRDYRNQVRYCRAYTDNKENTIQEKVCISLGGQLNVPGTVTGKNEDLGYIQYVLK